MERLARSARRLWPLNAYAWEFKFDLVPAALLAVGLALAYRERFGLAGLVLGIGAAVSGHRRWQCSLCSCGCSRHVARGTDCGTRWDSSPRSRR